VETSPSLAKKQISLKMPSSSTFQAVTTLLGAMAANFNFCPGKLAHKIVAK